MECIINKLKSSIENGLPLLSYRSLLRGALFLGLVPFTLLEAADNCEQKMESSKIGLFDADKSTNTLTPMENYSNRSEKCKEATRTGFYVGAFGGGGSSMSFDVTQRGTAFYFEAAGGPLAVDAKGDSSDNWLGFVGVHMGYEWLHRRPPDWHLTHALELEGYYASTTKKTDELTNPTDRLPLHQFKDKFPMNIGVVLVNWEMIWNNRSLFKLCPYIGMGMGSAILSIYHAQSTQVAPPEVGVNHFSSDTNATDWVFAFQGKAGARCAVSKYFRLFAEYRFLYLTSSQYTFGSTRAPGHVATSPWIVDLAGICNNMFALGIDIPL